MNGCLRIYVIGTMCVLFFAISIPLVFAQFLGGTQKAQAELVLNPTFPEPNTQVKVALNAYTYDLVGSTVRWFVDNTELTEAHDAREIEIVTKSLGVATDIVAVIKLRNGGIVRATQQLVPSYIDMIVEANTYVPTFYKGRKLGSAGSQIKITAIPHFGLNNSASQLTYTWKLNNKVLFGGSARGRQSIELTMPKVRESFLTVDITSDTGENIGQNTIFLSPQRARVVFYENNALRGVSHIAIPDEHILVGDEVTVRAEPYFINANDTNVLEEWRINGSRVDNPSNDQREITLRSAGFDVTSSVDYQFQSLSEFQQRARGEFLIRFNSNI